MTDFVQTMRDWKRMCKVYTREDEDDCCKGCPMGNMGEHGCDAIFSDFPEYGSWDDVEKIIDKWAAEHPEPVYPTWREWLIELGIVSFDVDFHSILDTRPTTLSNTVKAYINEEGSKPIPADTAQKLGLQPKEGV